MKHIIPPGQRCCDLPSSDVTTYADLKDAIVEHVERHASSGAVPLRIISARWSSHCKKHGKTPTETIRELAEEGRLAVCYIEGLRRTYILTAANFNEILAACDGMVDAYDWDTYGKGLDTTHK